MHNSNSVISHFGDAVEKKEKASYPDDVLSLSHLLSARGLDVFRLLTTDHRDID